MYAKGMTTRQISETIEDIYGFETSEGFISDVTDKSMPQIEDWQNRPLDEVYPILYMMRRTFLTSALDMPEIMLYIYSKSWKLQFSASSSIIIIEDYYLQTFLHSLNYSPYNHEETLDTNKYHFNMFFLQLDTLKYYFELPASLFSFSCNSAKFICISLLIISRNISSCASTELNFPSKVTLDKKRSSSCKAL